MAAAELGGLAVSARFAGFADALASLSDELAAAMLDPEPEGGSALELVRLVRAYREHVQRAGLPPDRAGLRARSATLLESRLDAWDGRPVLAYGFEDMTVAQVRALKALAARGPVTVSLPYESGRPAYAAVAPLVQALSEGGAEFQELPPGQPLGSPVLGHLERALFTDRRGGLRTQRPRPSATRRRLAGAAGGGRPARGGRAGGRPRRLALLREGVEPDQIGVIVPSVAAHRLPLEAAFAALRPTFLGGRASAAGPDRLRCRPGRGAALRLDRRRAARALRLPALALLRGRPAAGGLRRGPAARSRCDRPRRARSRPPANWPAAPSHRPSTGWWARTIRWPGWPRSPATCCGPPTRCQPALWANRAGSAFGPAGRCCGRWTRCAP